MDKYATAEEYRLGSFRNSMNNNPLLVKSELGRSLKKCYQLPTENFIYGKPMIAIDGGVAAAMIHREPENGRRKGKLKIKDFVKLNAAAVMTGLVTAKEHKHFRSINDIRVEAPRMNVSLNKSSLNLPPDMAFGIPTRPSTPMFDVLEHKFQEKWLMDKREAEIARRARMKEEERLQGHYLTRAALVRRHLPKVEDKRVWRMPQFLKAYPHLETFETPKKRRAAFKAHAADLTSRQGLFGHGIYEPAKR